MKVRLQKVIAQSGITSRRKAEELIQSGKVELNGEVVTTTVVFVDPAEDKIKVEGKALRPPLNEEVVYALYKPKSCVTTIDDPEGRTTIVSFFPKTKVRLFPAGRLDYDAEGLLLLTNSGELAQRLTHPGKHIWKTYFVKIKGKITRSDIVKLLPGPMIDGKKRQPVKIKFLHFVNEKSWVEVSLQEGVKHHIKKMFFKIGFPVEKIKRYSIGAITIDGLNPGETRRLSKNEIDALFQTEGSEK